MNPGISLNIVSFARTIFLLFCCTISAGIVQAQLSVSAGYSYLHNKDLDKIVQLYNTSRAWRDNKLYPLTHTAELSVGWNWQLMEKRQLHLLPQLGYGYTQSIMRNSSERLSTGFHRADILLQFRFHPKALIKGVQVAGPLGTRWFMTLAPGFSFIQPFVRSDRKSLENDDEKYRPRTSAFFTNAGVGYHLVMLNNKVIMTPEIGVQWYPKMEIENYASALNGHNITNLQNNFENVFLFQAKLRFTFIKAVVNWWDVPVRGS